MSTLNVKNLKGIYPDNQIAIASGHKLVVPSGGLSVSGMPIKHTRAEYSTRTTGIPTSTNPYVLWTPVSGYSRISTSNHLHVTAMLPGFNRYSYPFYGLFCRIVDGSSNVISTNYVGSNYVHSASGESDTILWSTDAYFTASTLGSNQGISIQFGWYSVSGGTNAPFEVWNPNVNDDNRGSQQGSICNVFEVSG